MLVVSDEPYYYVDNFVAAAPIATASPCPSSRDNATRCSKDRSQTPASLCMRLHAQGSELEKCEELIGAHGRHVLKTHQCIAPCADKATIARTQPRSRNSASFTWILSHGQYCRWVVFLLDKLRSAISCFVPFLLIPLIHIVPQFFRSSGVATYGARSPSYLSDVHRA